MQTFVPSHLLDEVLPSSIMERSSARCRSEGGQRQRKNSDEMHLKGVCNDELKGRIKI